jgi:hypothetical protein
LEIEKNYKEDVKWPEYEEIFTGGVPKRKPYQDPLRQPAPIVVRRLYWRSLPPETILFASIVITRREPITPYKLEEPSSRHHRQFVPYPHGAL